MSNRNEIFFVVFVVVAVLTGSIRLFLVYRRRKRWKQLMTSHPSLHFARRRITKDLPEEK